MDTVNDLMAEELQRLGLNPDTLGDKAQAVVPVLAQLLDTLVPTVGDDPEALRVVAAGLRSYARVADSYAAALDAGTP